MDLITTWDHGIGSDLTLIMNTNDYVGFDTYSGDGKAGGCLPSAHSSKPGLVLDNAVWDSHLPAQSWQEHHQLKQYLIESQQKYMIRIWLSEVVKSGHPVDQVKRFKASY